MFIEPQKKAVKNIETFDNGYRYRSVSISTGALCVHFKV